MDPLFFFIASKQLLAFIPIVANTLLTLGLECCFQLHFSSHSLNVSVLQGPSLSGMGVIFSSCVLFGGTISAHSPDSVLPGSLRLNLVPFLDPTHPTQSHQVFLCRVPHRCQCPVPVLWLLGTDTIEGILSQSQYSRTVLPAYSS